MGAERLRRRIVDRAGARTARAAEILADRVRDASGLPSGRVSTAGPRFAPPARWSSTLAVRGEGVTVWRWVYGDHSSRTAPFDPHVELDGLTFDETNWGDKLHSPDPFPKGSHYFPGDHKGCQCLVEVVVGDAPFPLGPSPRVVRRAGLTFTMRDDRTVAASALPPWWVEVVNQAGWRSALEEAR